MSFQWVCIAGCMVPVIQARFDTAKTNLLARFRLVGISCIGCMHSFYITSTGGLHELRNLKKTRVIAFV